MHCLIYPEAGQIFNQYSKFPEPFKHCIYPRVVIYQCTSGKTEEDKSDNISLQPCLFETWVIKELKI